jgi:pimeloyl-ACP methyl ester carboxylesterase
MGGTLSLLAAAAAPEKVRALALFDPVILPPNLDRPLEMNDSTWALGASRRRQVFDSRDAAVAAYRGRGGFASWSDPMLLDYVADGFKDRPDGAVELVCSSAWEVSNYLAQGHDSWAAFEASRCPIRILRAERGSTCQTDARIGPLTASGRIQVETIPGTTHSLPMERPELVRETLQRVIDESAV